MGVAEQDALRRSIIDRLRLDVLGPSSEDEVLIEDREARLGESPLSHYLLGILYPSNTPVLQDEDDSRAEAGADDEDNDSSAGVPAPVVGMPKPSSIGLSLAVSEAVDSVEAEFSYGLYQPNHLVPAAAPTGRAARPVIQWRRLQVRERIAIRLGGSGHVDLPGGGRGDWLSRRQDDGWLVSVFLRNANAPSSDYDQPEACLFQPSLTIAGDPASCPILDRTQLGARRSHDPDLETYRLLYRDRNEFAVGHGCAVMWDSSGCDPHRARSVRTELLPLAEVVPTVARGGAGFAALDMDALASAAAERLRELLEPLLDSYQAWIESLQLRAAALPSDLYARAAEHLADCRVALERMRSGLNLLISEPLALEAFQFANRAMALQRRQAVGAAARQRNEPSPENLAPEWRPFQAAFVLLNVVGVADPASEDRGLVDLLWFPTGGGKTEAYLGLAAFTMALRRLRAVHSMTTAANGDGGVTVLMRYTLRLLTIQQFQRAAVLICACEVLRRQNPARFGSVPFSVGLWVGGGSTPNKITQVADPTRSIEAGAFEVLRDFDPANEPSSANPVQIRSCPWCGATMTHTDYVAHRELLHLQVRCPDSTCSFHGDPADSFSGLPLYLVDEDLYLRCPTLVIATVDKFARLPWDDHTKALFGDVDARCDRHGWLARGADYRDCRRTHRRRGSLPATSPNGCSPFLPPELIIQDELHLITGPLGSLVGLYEGAIDALASQRDSARPKVIASTATIRRFSDQISGLFQRPARQFPPPGLDAGDAFFAAETTELPGRLFLGLCAPGRSLKTAAIRCLASLLHTPHLAQRTHSPSDLDPFWTVVAYYNSLRELGGALRLVEDDVRQRLTLLAVRDGSTPPRLPERHAELTSRIAPRDVSLLLRQMERPLGSADVLDVLLCTNMISVGVDIARFGLMLVTGQPKTSAEYIQATSRVGRQAPGLVLTLYNWSRPRDLSHYERFTAYHSMLYRHVEVTSVTPWAGRARDRGLHAVFVGLLRLLHPNLATDAGARRFDAADPLVSRVRDQLVERVRGTDPGEADAVRRELQAVIDNWALRVRSYPTSLTYRRPQNAPDQPATWLLEDAEDAGVRSEFPRGTLNSLREVEGTAALYPIALRRNVGDRP